MFDVICTGLEVALLVVVAGQLGFMVPMREGLLWIVVQTAMLGDASYTRALHARITYGLGIQLVQIDGRPALGHSGRYLGYRNVVRYLPRFRGARKPDVSVRMLLDHTSGLPPYRPLYRLARTRNAVQQRLARRGDHVFATMRDLDGRNRADRDALERLALRERLRRRVLALDRAAHQ